LFSVSNPIAKRRNAMGDDKAKVAAVETEKYDGIIADTKATVTTDEGKSASATAAGKERAIEKAAEKAR
jgi:hypothetical protein